jgi:hypothetical protein
MISHRLKEKQVQEYALAKLQDEERQRQMLEEAKFRAAQEELKVSAAKEKKEVLQLKRASIPPEPDSNDPAALEIALRFPSGKRIVRRFLKSASIQVSRLCSWHTDALRLRRLSRRPRAEWHAL